MKTWQECCDHFNVDTERGLSTDQVEKNLKKYGANGKEDYDIIQAFFWPPEKKTRVKKLKL